MTLPPRFCTACGAPLSPGARFCEECGQPAEGIPPPASPALPVVVPFGKIQGGFLSQKDVLLVIGKDFLLFVIPPPGMAKSLHSLQETLSAALEGNAILPRDFWEASASLDPTLPRAYCAPRQISPDLRSKVASIRSRLALDRPPYLRFREMSVREILAECPGSWQIPLDTVLYVRGEDCVEEAGGEDLLVVRTPDRELHAWFSLGCYYTARATLLSRTLRRFGVGASPDRIVSIVPACFEPGPENFGFQYVFSLIFTDQQLLLAVTPGSEDHVEHQWDAFMERLKREARERGVTLEAFVAGASLADAPWQVFSKMTPAEILDSDGVNYAIPYASLRAVAYQGGNRPRITLSFPSHTLELEANSLFAPRFLKKAQAELEGKVTITL